MYNRGFFQTPNDVLELDDLNMRQKIVLICFYRCGNQRSPIYPSFNTIARRCSISRTTVIKTVRELVEVGLIDVRHRKSKRKNNTNIYTINDDVVERKAKEQLRLRRQSEANNQETDENDGIRLELCSTSRALGVVSDADSINNPDQEPRTKNYREQGPESAQDFADSRLSLLSFEKYSIESEYDQDDDHILAVEYFLEKYEETFGRKHRSMKYETWDKATSNVLEMYEKPDGEEIDSVGEIDLNDICEIIDLYFLKKYQKGCDYSIPHFNNPAIKAILYHRSGLR